MQFNALTFFLPSGYPHFEKTYSEKSLTYDDICSSFAKKCVYHAEKCL